MDELEERRKRQVTTGEDYGAGADALCVLPMLKLLLGESKAFISCLF